MFCFIHIEKAAGTTLHSIFLDNFATYSIVTPWPYWTNEEENVFLPEEVKDLRQVLRFSKGIGGHTVRTYLSYEKVLDKRIHYITFVREPISRYISHFRYQRNIMNIDISFEKFIEEKRFNNFMTKRIAGIYDIDLAKKYLENHFSFVGITEKFNESLILMNNIIFQDNLKILHKKKNVSNYNNIEDYKLLYKEKLMENNSLDIELYNFTKNYLYPRYLDVYEGNINEEVIKLNNNLVKNKLKRSIIKRVFSRLFDECFYFFEKRVHQRYHDLSQNYL